MVLLLLVPLSKRYSLALRPLYYANKIWWKGKKIATKTKVTYNGKSEVFLGHMAMMWSCDCTSQKDKPSWRRVRRYFTYFHFLKHLSVVVINLFESRFAYSIRALYQCDVCSSSFGSDDFSLWRNKWLNEALTINMRFVLFPPV